MKSKMIFEEPLFLEDISKVASLNLPWNILKNKTLLVSGATGLIGSFLIDVIMKRNMEYSMNCKIYALGRNLNKAEKRFGSLLNGSNLSFIPCDINKPLNESGVPPVDYVLHLASNTHPVAYATDPIGTVTTNVIGTKNLLDFCVSNSVSRFLFASTVEVYGENRGDVDRFTEDYCGYIDCNTLRAGYPESKRCGEALCQAYIKQCGLDIVIPRFSRTYGPTMLMDDSKAISQFILKAINGNDIVLKSDGMQFYSFSYVADAVSGLLTILLKGKCGEAYNISDSSSDIHLKDLASLIAGYCKKHVVFELPDAVEQAGYSKATNARLDSDKLQRLGWKADYSISEGIQRTITILRDMINQ
ncbi:NAD-dependent epimerase/dehydratase family protein [uncultured Dialister sp.]|uniref:NAD-dependent epimerase/dehydratase family protein n=1 Tax=uncultured Dialister sp. TaxID=278064 RepID=UPI0025906F97|nr:NAD-dependent epimerase/dehydratase family protein [uncultured Dialister sp.]